MDWLGGARLRAVLEQQAQAQPDGSFLVRPFGRIPWIYQVDAATRDRLVRFQMEFSRFAIVALMLGALAFGRSPWMWPWGLLAIVAFIIAVGWGGRIFVLRHSPRVARDRWTGPPGPSLVPLFSRRVYLGCLWLSVMTMVISAEQVRSALRQPDAAFPWLSATVLLISVAWAGYSWVFYRRSARS